MLTKSLNFKLKMLIKLCSWYAPNHDYYGIKYLLSATCR